MKKLLAEAPTPPTATSGIEVDSTGMPDFVAMLRDFDTRVPRAHEYAVNVDAARMWWEEHLQILVLHKSTVRETVRDVMGSDDAMSPDFYDVDLVSGNVCDVNVFGRLAILNSDDSTTNTGEDNEGRLNVS